MALTTTQLQDIVRKTANRYTRTKPMDMVTTDLEDAANAVTTWFEGGMVTSLNGALPNPFKTNSTLEEQQALVADVGRTITNG